jgi:hypothetical protein
MTTVTDLRAQLIAAQKLTGQSSYERRAPSPKSIPALLKVKADIHEFLLLHGHEAQAHRLLSTVQECLLNYPGARASLELAIQISPQRDAKDLKRLALLREYEKKWAELPISPVELASLGSFLEHALSKQLCDHTLEQTRCWLSEHSPTKIDSKLKAIRHWGGYCDCEVLYNVV